MTIFGWGFIPGRYTYTTDPLTCCLWLAASLLAALHRTQILRLRALRSAQDDDVGAGIDSGLTVLVLKPDFAGAAMQPVRRGW
jgi:hypothetical protein